MKALNNIMREGIYRSRNGVLLGVCKGIADAFDFSVFWLRVIVIVLMFFSGFWPVIIIYAIAALVMKPEPVIPLDSNEEQEFYDQYVQTPAKAAQRLKKRYEHLERRIRYMEHLVTTPEYDWNRRFDSGKKE